MKPIIIYQLKEDDEIKQQKKSFGSFLLTKFIYYDIIIIENKRSDEYK